MSQEKKVKLQHRCNTPGVDVTPQDRANHAEFEWKCPTCKQKWWITCYPNETPIAIRWGRTRYLKRRKTLWFI